MMEERIRKRVEELGMMAQSLVQQVILTERNLQGLREQHASVQGAMMELSALLKEEKQPVKKKKQQKVFKEAKTTEDHGTKLNV